MNFGHLLGCDTIDIYIQDIHISDICIKDTYI